MALKLRWREDLEEAVRHLREVMESRGRWFELLLAQLECGFTGCFSAVAEDQTSHLEMASC